MKYKVTEIEYCIEPEDVADEANEFFGIGDEEEIEDHGIFRYDYENKCDEIIEGILDRLPGEMTVEIDDDVADVDCAIVDAVSDRTGWLVLSLAYEPVETQNEHERKSSDE